MLILFDVTYMRIMIIFLMQSPINIKYYDNIFNDNKFKIVIIIIWCLHTSFHLIKYLSVNEWYCLFLFTFFLSSIKIFMYLLLSIRIIFNIVFVLQSIIFSSIIIIITCIFKKKTQNLTSRNNCSFLFLRLHRNK